MKHEWRKHEKALYLPKTKPELVTVPRQKFLMIKGRGNPNSPGFSERIGVLYALAYAIRMMPKNGFTPEGYEEYTVYPLEGLWDLTEEGKNQDHLDKNELLYTIMIRQPEFVTPEVVAKAFEITRKKKPHVLLDEVTFGELEDGLSVQVLHNGPYDTESESFGKMKSFIEEHAFEIVTLEHREIYIKAARDTPTQEELAKLKTVLRYRVREKR